MKNTLDAVPIHLDQSKKTEFRDTRLEDSQSELQRKKNTHSHWMSKEQEMCKVITNVYMDYFITSCRFFLCIIYSSLQKADL